MTGTLYPFLSAGTGDAESVIAAAVRSTADKALESAALRQQVLDRFGTSLAACAAAMSAAFAAGGRLFTFGNGGSSTDALALARLFAAAGLPAMCLTSDAALLTALSNDVSFEVVFSRQLAALGRAGDMAVALSTSGGSANVARGLGEARRLGMLTAGFAGSGGGRMAQDGLADHLFVVPSASVHRIQEAQTTLYHVLRELTVV